VITGKNQPMTESGSRSEILTHILELESVFIEARTIIKFDFFLHQGRLKIVNTLKNLDGRHISRDHAGPIV
jgi:hypothetical protein